MVFNGVDMSGINFFPRISTNQVKYAELMLENSDLRLDKAHLLNLVSVQCDEIKRLKKIIRKLRSRRVKNRRYTPKQ